MSCYSKEGVEDSSSESNYPNIPDFSQMRVNESNTPANVCKYCYKAFMECGCSQSGALWICANIAAESDFKPDLITWDGSKKSGKFGIGGGLCGFYRFGDLPALAQHAKKPSIADIEKLDDAIRNCGKLPLPTTPASNKNAKFIRENFTKNFPRKPTTLVVGVCQQFSIYTETTGRLFDFHYQRPLFWYKNTKFAIRCSTVVV